jgi:hypothetical protein
MKTGLSGVIHLIDVRYQKKNCIVITAPGFTSTSGAAWKGSYGYGAKMWSNERELEARKRWRRSLPNGPKNTLSG